MRISIVTWLLLTIVSIVLCLIGDIDHIYQVIASHDAVYKPGLDALIGAFLLFYILTSSSLRECISRFQIQYVKHAQRGFILLDSIFSIVIVATALTAIAVTYQQSTVNTLANKNYTKAMFIAQRAAEELKKNDGAATTAAFDWSVTQPEAEANSPIFEVTTEPLPLEQIAPLNQHLLARRIIVRWTERNIDQSLQLTSYYYHNAN